VFLKSLEIFGFKSFADKVRIDFADGVAALLGPNGCGKSNVVDSVKWVLGEQSTKSLRAEKMEDVIFAGSDTRKPLNVAEVTLTFSNEHEILPVEYTEVAIKRRIYRSGESEYFINNSPMKLKDIRELFFDTGIGKSAYSIMEQGKIDQLLSTKPEERRYIFEEAAGITRFRARGAEAERKLEKTEENMHNVEAILAEVKKNYNALKSQAEKADQYRKLREDIFEAELEIQLIRLKGFLEEKKKKDARLEEKARARDELKGKIDAVSESITKQADMVNDMEARLNESHRKIYQLDMERGKRESALRMFKERTTELEAKAAADAGRRTVTCAKIAELEDEAERKKLSLVEFDARIKEIEGNVEGFTEDIARFSERVQENEGTIRRNEAEIQGLDGTLEERRVELRAITDDIVTQLDQRLKETGYSSQERRKTEEEIRQTLERVRIQLSGKGALLADAEKIESMSKQDRTRLAQATLAVIRGALESLTVLDGLFEKFGRFAPSFLDDFLAPEGIITRKREIDEKINDILSGISTRRQSNGELGKENQGLREKIEEYRKTLEGLRVNLARTQTQRAGVEAEIKRLEREKEEQGRLLAEIGQEIENTKARIADVLAQSLEAEKEKLQIAEEEKAQKSALTGLEGEITERNKDLLSKEHELKEKSALLARAQGEIEKLQMEATEVRTEIKNLYANFAERFSRDLSEFETRMPDLQPSQDIRPRLASLREEMKKLGQVNLMAPEEFAEVRDRHDFLANQLTDLQKAREDLHKVTEEIRTESSELFLDTYNKVKKNFHTIFRRLFGGGRAELRLETPENVLESGIEIFVQPPGKKLENIALLSGGEKSLTGVSLMFAVYMVRPSPFCLLDEIDAALDEENVGRLTGMLREFSNTSQFVVITHNKRTVAGADVLYGVTMEESGVTKLVGIRLENKANRMGEQTLAPAQ